MAKELSMTKSAIAKRAARAKAKASKGSGEEAVVPVKNVPAKKKTERGYTSGLIREGFAATNSVSEAAKKAGVSYAHARSVLFPWKKK